MTTSTSSTNDDFSADSLPTMRKTSLKWCVIFAVVAVVAFTARHFVSDISVAEWVYTLPNTWYNQIIYFLYPIFIALLIGIGIFSVVGSICLLIAIFYLKSSASDNYIDSHPANNE